MVKFMRLFVFFLSCGSIVLFSSCGSRESDPPETASRIKSVLTVDGVVLHPRVLDNIVRSSGTVLASESVDLSPETAGKVDKILFQEGKHVKANELLVSLNDDDLQAQLKKTELQIQLSTEQLDRQKQMYTISGISKEQLDIAQNQVNTLKADRDNLKALIRKREIRAPFDGVIGLRYVSVGSYVSPTSKIASIQKINPLKVDFAIPEKYSDQVSPGDEVQFRTDETKQQFTGTVYAIEPKIDPNTRTLQLRALCENRSEKILPGSYVQIELRLKKITDALMAPTQSIIPVLKGQTVYVKKHGVSVSVPVTIGIRTATEVQIVSGLSAGDTVLTTGLMQMREGEPVNVVVR